LLVSSLTTSVVHARPDVDVVVYILLFFNLFIYSLFQVWIVQKY